MEKVLMQKKENILMNLYVLEPPEFGFWIVMTLCVCEYDNSKMQQTKVMKFDIRLLQNS